MGELVEVQVTDGVATVRLNRPPMNAINAQLHGELRTAAATISSTPEIRAVVIYGGERTFAAGADVKEMADKNYGEVSLMSPAMHLSYNAVAAIPKPVVAAITGYALGGGLELTLCADFRVCGERSKFGLPEITLGIIPGAGGTQRLPRLIGPARAKSLIYTGRQIDAEEALRIGLVDQVVPDGEVYEAATKLAAQFRSGPAQALRAAKQAVDTGLSVDLDTGLAIERAQFSALFATEDQKHGMSSFVENGPGKAHFVGA
jgi:enoyl-CoA hydratase/carnithine racemase